MSAPHILDYASAFVEGQREIYGPPAEVMAAIAARWSLTLGHPVTPAQVVLCMIDLKLVRLIRNPEYRETVVDVIGYAALLSEVPE